MRLSSEQLRELCGKKLNYYFRDLDLLFEALTHPSYMVNQPSDGSIQSYQRLEFIGDKILNLIIAETLFRYYPEKREGVLTRYTNILASNAHFARVGRELRLGDYIKLARGAERQGFRTNDYVLACVFEAIAGAMFIDSDGGYMAIKKLLERHIFAKPIPTLVSDEALLKADPKGHLQELSQGKFGHTPEYSTVGMFGKQDSPSWTVRVLIGGIELGRGSGKSVNDAEKKAAQYVLDQTHRLTRNIPFQLLQQRDVFGEISF